MIENAEVTDHAGSENVKTKKTACEQGFILKLRQL